ncbi:TonB-dependent receptor [Novosphingobium flavum]|uniref:TonB-dependent receptor n=1 Tax=Novosphingobium flavum TaxID=1778672 RepID=A0A7X1KKW9_9SPHN|nr:TonB-dependent receptor [Novosphingobium flavum]MBC2664917.1 TonB-dependent receptor [Novosphingobium flavum]
MRNLLVSTSVLAILASVQPVFAQEQTETLGAAEIIVTAQKRTERLQEIPVAAAVLGGNTIEQAHVTDLSDINRVVPSVEIKGTFNGRVPYGIRGISTNANEGAIGLTSGVSIQVDGVPVPADSFAANTITDVAQLEVLKGPQATLGGRTASAGVINFVTNGPSSTFKGGFSASATDDGEVRGEGYVAGPLSEGVSFSLSAYDTHTPFPVYNITRGEKSAANSWGIRGKLKFELTDRFSVGLMGHYALSRSHGENFVPVYFTPGASVFPFIPYTFDTNGVPTAYGIPQSVAFPGYTIGYGNGTYASPVEMRSRYEDLDGSVTLNYEADGLTFNSVTSLFQEKQYQSQDVFETNVYFFDVLTGGHAPHFGNFQEASGKVRQFTQELKVSSDAARPINFIAGLFYSNMIVDQTGLRAWVANPTSKRNISSTQNYAAYARVTARLTDAARVVAGLRYNHDKIGWNVSQYLNPAAGQYQGCGAAASCQWILSDSSDVLVGDIALQYDLSRGVMGYASYTRGYKPKAFNTVHDFASAQSAPVAADVPFTKATAQEHIDSFEVGLKSSLLGGHMTFNLAAFYTKYNGYQAQLFDNSAVIGVLVLANAGARTAGVEADVNYVQGNTRFGLSAAYIDAKFTSFKGATCWPDQTTAQGCVGGAQDLSGKPLPASPKFKFNANVTQTVPLSAFNVVLGGNLAYRTDTLLQADQNPRTRQPAFALLDLSLGFQTKDEKATLTLFVNNVTNHFYYTNMEDFFSGATGTAAVPSGVVSPGNYVIGQPARDARRYFGGRVSYKF